MKNILVSVLGSSPQIITELLYDFIVQQKMNINELHIITTVHGRQKCEQLLFDNGLGAFYKFCQDYTINSEDIQRKIHVINDLNGTELDDIRSDEDNKAAADYITKTILELTINVNSRLLASIAGGRKTMSSYMAYAMQLYGREQDKLYHILVAPDILERQPSFFYPPKGPGSSFQFMDRNKKQQAVPRSEIHITNAEIPFIRLRDHLNVFDNLNISAYNTMVELTQKNLEESLKPSVEIDNVKKEIVVRWHNQQWRLKPKRTKELALYRFLLDQKSLLITDDEIHNQKLIEIYRELKGDPEYPATFESKEIGEYVSRLNKDFRDHINNETLCKYLLIKRPRSKKRNTISLPF